MASKRKHTAGSKKDNPAVEVRPIGGGEQAIAKLLELWHPDDHGGRREALAKLGLSPQVATDGDLQAAFGLLSWIAVTLETDARAGVRTVEVNGQELNASELWGRMREALRVFEAPPVDGWQKHSEGEQLIRVAAKRLRGEVGAHPGVRKLLTETAVEDCWRGLVALDRKFEGLDRGTLEQKLREVRVPKKQLDGTGKGQDGASELLKLAELAIKVEALKATRNDTARKLKTNWHNGIENQRKKRSK